MQAIELHPRQKWHGLAHDYAVHFSGEDLRVVIGALRLVAHTQHYSGHQIEQLRRVLWRLEAGELMAHMGQKRKEQR